MKRPLRGTAVRGDAGEAPGGLRGENIALAVSPRLSNLARIRYPRACITAVFSVAMTRLSLWKLIEC